MEYDEFRATTLKLRSKKNFKITNSYGTKEAWRWIKKNKWLNIGQPITEHDFGTIIKSINLFLQDQLLQGHDINLPLSMGRIELRKFKTHIKVGQEGIKTNMMVDWKRTLELWNEDIEAKNNKTLIRMEAKEIFKFYYHSGFPVRISSWNKYNIRKSFSGRQFSDYCVICRCSEICHCYRTAK